MDLLFSGFMKFLLTKGTSQFKIAKTTIAKTEISINIHLCKDIAIKGKRVKTHPAVHKEYK